MNIAIITGASSGLGREFALQLCHNYAAEIDEIWLLARRKEPLLTLAQEISATGICVGAAMPMDITDKEQMKDFQDKLEIEVPTVKYLINCCRTCQNWRTIHIAAGRINPYDRSEL